eukprot:scaffold84546_cov20-Prasinocladus_malaysianus.AAC.2
MILSTLINAASAQASALICSMMITALLAPRRINFGTYNKKQATSNDETDINRRASQLCC